MVDGYEAGQAWRYDAPKGFEGSRIVIGAILSFAHHEPVICAAVIGAPGRGENGELAVTTIPFLPFSKSSFDATVVALDGMADVPVSFNAAYDHWKQDAQGLRCLEVPFKSLLQNMAHDVEAQIHPVG